MESAARYEIIDLIASGDFATVFRARDRELGREVAVKQIHPQFLHDAAQLTRFWQEAQLLATLPHPHIVTIYDLARPQGWLILELMRGNLKQLAERGPLDLDFLRFALACGLNALAFLHRNGVIHGDVKPGNLLLDAQGRVKLGDFGLARRALSDAGSLLKGTTKYMAPELVSNQFGPVGPAADLYSLGFSAYELLCGPHFEALFPGLDTFGRDRQIAWLMWHAAADRNLPEIGRVLQGVPDDLARVIERLVQKDQARRYTSADAVLEDLRAQRLGATALPPPAPPAPPRRKKWTLIGGAVGLGLLATVMLLALPSGKKPLAGRLSVEPVRGVIRDVLAEEQRFVVESVADGQRREIGLKAKDRIFINQKETRVFRDLQPGDEVEIRVVQELDRGRVTEVHAARAQRSSGRIKQVQADVGRLILRADDGQGGSVNREITVPTSLRISLNGRTEMSSVPGAAGKRRPIGLADLRADDRVVVSDIRRAEGLVAIALAAQREVSFPGVLRSVDQSPRQIVVALGSGQDGELVTLPLAADCKVTLNDRTVIQQRLLSVGDLRPGDQVTVYHDVQVQRVDAYRILGHAGVIQRVQYENRLLEVAMEPGPTTRNVLVPAACKITLGGDEAAWEDLRSGDLVDITHDTPDAKVAEAKAISARRPPDPKRWALLVGGQAYDDQRLSPLVSPLGDLKRLQEVLVKRHRVPLEQMLVLADESLVRIDQAISSWLPRLEETANLVVYVTGHAYRDEDGKVYLAPKNFDLKRMGVTGLPLQWLLEQLEGCKAKEKLWLLDTSFSGEGADLRAQPSTADMLRSLQGPPGYPALRTVTAVASCRGNQRGQVLGKTQSLFARGLVEAFSGKADKSRDGRLEPTELFEFLGGALASAGAAEKLVQQPELFLPDARPPRLTVEARQAILKLAGHLKSARLDGDALREEFKTATELAGKAAEPRLLYGLLLMRMRQRDDAYEQFQDVAAEHPKLTLPLEGQAWLSFDRLAYSAGVGNLLELVKRTPLPKNPNAALPTDVARRFQWVGQLREFAAIAAIEGRRPGEGPLKALDEAIQQHGAAAIQAYEQGRAQTRSTALQIDRRASAADDEATRAKARMDRRTLAGYATFPYDDVAAAVLALLEQP